MPRCGARKSESPEIKYKVPGAEGRQCCDCKFFEPVSGESSKGKCFGKDVVAQGTCNMFASK